VAVAMRGRSHEGILDGAHHRLAAGSARRAGGWSRHSRALRLVMPCRAAGAGRALPPDGRRCGCPGRRISRVPRMAIPNAEPTWRKVLWMPEACPRLRAGRRRGWRWSTGRWPIPPHAVEEEGSARVHPVAEGESRGWWRAGRPPRRPSRPAPPAATRSGGRGRPPAAGTKDPSEGHQHHPGAEGRVAEHRLHEEGAGRRSARTRQAHDQRGQVAVAERAEAEERQVDDHGATGLAPTPFEGEEGAQQEHPAAKAGSTMETESKGHLTRGRRRGRSAAATRSAGLDDGEHDGSQPEGDGGHTPGIGPAPGGGILRLGDEAEGAGRHQHPMGG